MGALSLPCFSIHGNIALFMTTIKNLWRDSSSLWWLWELSMDFCPISFKLIWGQPSSPHHLRLIMIGGISRSAMTQHPGRNYSRCEPWTPKIATQLYVKCFVPLASDPTLLDDLMHTLGISGSQALTVVWSIEDPIQLSLILCPVFALIPILPTSEEYEWYRQSKKVPLRLQRIQSQIASQWRGARTWLKRGRRNERCAEPGSAMLKVG